MRFYLIRHGWTVANETLAILFGDVPYETDPRFREVDFGEFEMYSHEQLKHRPDFQAWLDGDHEANVPPGGESGVQMRRRAVQAFSELLHHGAGISGDLIQREGPRCLVVHPAVFLKIA